MWILKHSENTNYYDKKFRVSDKEAVRSQLFNDAKKAAQRTKEKREEEQRKAEELKKVLSTIQVERY